CSMEAKDKAVARIVDSSAPADQRRQAILEIILHVHFRNSAELSQTILNGIDPLMFPMLREVVRKNREPDSFNYAAAAALAHFGDSEIRPTLESYVPLFEMRDRNFGGI